jgi:hypothetical protein
MNINAERFLRMTALLAAASAASCSSNTTNNNIQPTNNGGNGGSTTELDGGGGGATGKAGAAGKGGSGGGGASGVNEAGTDASPDSGKDGGGGGSAPTCLGDTVPVVPVHDAGAHDAGAESLGPCPDVPTASLFCQPDSGAEGFAPAAALFCSGGQNFVFRAGVFGAIEKCLAALPVSEACTAKHTAAALACYDQAAANACPQIPATDGGDPCTTLHKNCDGVSLDDCHHALNAFSGESGAPPDIATCLATSGDAGTCTDRFWACVLPYGVTR